MKNILKQIALLFCAVSLTSAAWAQGPSPTARFDGNYFSAAGSGPISRVEATVDYGDFYGTVFLRGVDTYDFLYFSGEYIDRAGNIHGTFYGYDYEGDAPRPFYGYDDGTFTGRVSGNTMVLTFKCRQGTVTVVLLKGRGYAPTFIAGRIVYVYGYGSLYFDDTKVWADDYVPYTYRKTGPNTATVTIQGQGTYRITFTDQWDGFISGPELKGDSEFYSYDYSED